MRKRHAAFQSSTSQLLARGVIFTHELLQEILGSLPRRSLDKPGFESSRPAVDGQALFTEAVFQERADFQHVYFGYAHFDKCTFEGEVLFNGSVFDRGASLRGVRLAEGDFAWLSVGGEIRFEAAQLERITLHGSVLDGDAHFEEMSVSESCSFSQVSFGGEVFLSAAKLGSDDRADRTATACQLANAEFRKPAHFEDTEFEGALVADQMHFRDWIDFRFAKLRGPATFTRCLFEGDTYFMDVSFMSAAFFRESRMERASFDTAQFAAEADFTNAVFTSSVTFQDAAFDGRTRFSGSTVGRAAFTGITVRGKLLLGFDLGEGSRVEIANASGRGDRPPEIHFGPMSLNGVSLHSFDPSGLRFRGSRDLARLAWYDLTWPEKSGRYLVADEEDRQDPRGQDPPTAGEVERIYRGLRQSRENLNDRVGSHGWYFSEMEIGRQASPRWSVRRVVRDFYKSTSDYGLSVWKPLIWLVAAGLTAFLLFSVPQIDLCPVHLTTDGTTECVGSARRGLVVLAAPTFQSLPPGIEFVGVPGYALWIGLRLFGGAMLVSTGIALRNQVAR